MKLVIVESPTKARTLSRFLGKGYDIEATYGHLRDLPKKKLGVDVENDFSPEYKIVHGRKKRVGELKKMAKDAEMVILATDPDREGEAIAYHTAALLGHESAVISHEKRKDRKKADGKRDSLLKRIVFHEITKGAIEGALEEPRGIDLDLVHAQQARRVLDRLVGYKLSPLLWKKVRSGLSAGRVQSVAVRLIVEKEKERDEFEAEEYWNFDVLLSKNKTSAKSPVKAHVSKYSAEGNGKTEDKKEIDVDLKELLNEDSFIASLEKIDGKKLEIDNEKDAAVVVTDLGRADYLVTDIERKEAKRSPYPPFTTSTLQQTASRYMGWSGKKTMMHAQRLYEQGKITYHRTDSYSLSKHAVAAAREFIKGEYGERYLPKKPRGYKTKSKVAQEAHEAIRPTDVEMRNEGKRMKKKKGEMKNGKGGKLGRDDLKLYGLIWKRFVACQMSNAVYDRTKIVVQAKGKDRAKVQYELWARGEILKFDGWMRVMERAKRDDTLLPEVEEEERLAFVELDPQQKFTQPPARYSEATLIKTLEKEGIGRPSTYAPIISTIQDRHYVERDEDKRFFPTKLGIAVTDFLVKNFPKVLELKFTAQLEDQLDAIAKGEEEWAEVLQKFYGPFEKKLKKVEKTSERVKIPVERLDEECPECGKGELVIKIGKYGKFVACDRFPECKYSRNYVEKAGITCPECGEDIIIKKSRKGKRFYGCSNYPECEFAAWKKTDIPSNAEENNAD